MSEAEDSEVTLTGKDTKTDPDDEKTLPYSDGSAELNVTPVDEAAGLNESNIPVNATDADQGSKDDALSRGKQHLQDLRREIEQAQVELEVLKLKFQKQELEAHKQQLLRQQYYHVSGVQRQTPEFNPPTFQPTMNNPVQQTPPRMQVPDFNAPTDSHSAPRPSPTLGWAQQTVPMDSTPVPQSTQPGRRSWDPSEITGGGSTLAAALTEAFGEMLNQSRQANLTVVDALQMPQGDIEKFDGDPIKYHTFMQGFRSSVDGRSVDAATKLSCLHRHLTGQAKVIIEYTNAMDPQSGYREALAVLEERFGNKFRIGQAWTQRIMDRPPVKGHGDLRQFADMLRNCQQTMRAMSTNRLDNPQTLQAIWRKLPQYLQDRWTREDMKIQNQQQRETTLSDMTDFVARAADEANHPVFGRAVLSKEKTEEKPKGVRPKSEKRQAGSFAANTSAESATSNTHPVQKHAPTGKCVKCNGVHPIFACQEFKKLRVIDRRELAKNTGLCFSCLQQGHVANSCPVDKTCGVGGCTSKHNKFLHMPRGAGGERQAGTPPGNTSSQTTLTDSKTPTEEGAAQSAPADVRSSNFARGTTGKVALPIVPVRVRVPNSDAYEDTYALLDPGTDSTYCSELLREKLGAVGQTQKLELNTLTQASVGVEAQVVALIVSNLEETERSLIPEVTVFPKLNIAMESKADRIDIQKWPHLKDLDIPEVNDHHVNLLIGLDCPDLLRSTEERSGKRGEPFARRTPLGWAINGPMGFAPGKLRRSHFVSQAAPLERNLERLWEMEGTYSEDEGMSVADRRMIEVWEQSLTVDDGHYTMDIPFKDVDQKLTNNRKMAEKRIESLQRRLKSDEQLKQKYVTEMKRLLNRGYAEPVPEDELGRADGKVWYLPHQPVINPKKPDKCRIVNDCAAQYEGRSLNDQVMQGPDLANSLVGVLLRFRRGDVAFMADIEAMFMQIKVTPKHRDVLRFLWFQDHDIGAPLTVCRMTRHLFGGVWSPSCANYALRATAREFQEMYPAEVVETVRRNFYVDDCLKSVDGIEETTQLAVQLRDLLAERGFKLTKWVSNEPEFLKSIPREEWGKGLNNLNVDGNPDTLPEERALGIIWDMEADTFRFDVHSPDNPMTKRGVLSTLSSLYDPLGLTSPFILRARQIFQQMVRLKLDWDDPLPAELKEPWGRWIADLEKMKDLSVSRCLKPKGTVIQSAQLHHFSDASELAYGAASYPRLICSDGTIQVHLMMAKSRLTPLKGSTIPRLELAGALEAVRLDRILRKELDMELRPSQFWTDSTIVLWYVNHTEKRFQTYVANRVAKILSHTKATQWRHVPTELNPGDDASRGLAADELLTDDRWKHGPGFLKEDSHRWPQTPSLNSDECEKQAELKRPVQAYATGSMKTQMDAPDDSFGAGKLLLYHSSWFRLRKAVAWHRRMILLMKHLGSKKMNRPDRTDVPTGPLKPKELQAAETAILRLTQRSLPHDKTMLALGPALSDDGLKRVTGRLGQAKVQDEAKHQVLLPAGDHVTRLIVQEAHQKAGHAGVERVMADLRQRYWLEGGRSDVRAVVGSCVTCRRIRGKLGMQLMADLPESRTKAGEPPFSRTGVDYFGPLEVKRGRSTIKRYGCLFTCFSTRAIHLEVAFSMDTDSFLNALMRFEARRGQPKEIWCDNGTNFIGAQAELKRTIQGWDKTKIDQHMLRQATIWHFNPPGASHMGGVWERQIWSVRSALVGLGGGHILDDEGLLTLMTMVEGIVNSRPITRLSDDPEDDRPLTPNHLLRLAPAPTVPPGDFTWKDTYRRRWLQVQAIADEFWDRWLKEYLPTLQARQRWTKTERNFEPGDLVLLSQAGTPRNRWPLGLVVDIRRSWDGLVRSVVVKTSSGEYTRPITRLCLLEGAVNDP